jgi:hypothetical protein
MKGQIKRDTFVNSLPLNIVEKGRWKEEKKRLTTNQESNQRDAFRNSFSPK